MNSTTYTLFWAVFAAILIAAGAISVPWMLITMAVVLTLALLSIGVQKVGVKNALVFTLAMGAWSYYVFFV